jgi:hypothetical protein
MTTKTNPKGAGRKTVMTQQKVDKLEEYFAKGLTDQQACIMVDIDPKTLYNYCDKHPEFSSKKEYLKKQVNITAKLNIVDAIQEGSIKESMWWAERKMKDEFATRTETTGANGGAIKEEIIINQDEIRKRADEMRADSV